MEKRTRIGIVVISIFVVILIIVTGLSISFEPRSYKQDLLKSGDVLFFSITAKNATMNRTDTGVINVVGHYDGGGVTISHSPSYEFLPSGLGYAPELSEKNLAFDSSLGTFLGDRMTNTVFGEKFVSTYAAIDKGFIVIREIGQESGLIYRKIVCNSTFQLWVELNGTYNRDIWVADEVDHSQATPRGSHVVPNDDYMVCRNMMPVNVTFYSYGLLSVQRGEIVRYSIVGGVGDYYFIPIDELSGMEANKSITFSASLSEFDCHDGDYNRTAAEGTYFFAVLVNAKTEVMVSYWWN